MLHAWWWSAFCLLRFFAMEEVDEPPEVVERFLKDVMKLSRASAMNERHSIDKQQRLWRLTRRMQDRWWLELEHEAVRRNASLAYVYMSDGWGCAVSENVKVPSVDGKFTKREKKERIEWLMEKQILRALFPDGSLQVRMKSSLPRVMSGKSGWHVFGGSLDTDPLKPRCRTIVVQTIYLQDGMHHENFGAKQVARHDMLADALGEEGVEDANEYSDSDIVWFFHCITHVMSLALKWGLKIVVTRVSLLDGVHIMIASLRNSSGSLMDESVAFLHSRMRHRDSTSMSACRHRFWVMMGISPEALALFEEVDPWYDRDLDVFWVSGALPADGDAFDKAHRCLLYGMRWKNFVEMRWGGVGPCGRLWMVSEALGVSHLARSALQNASVNTEKLGGYKVNSVPDVRLFLVVAALASWPIESAIMTLVEDDRFFLHLDHIEQDFRAEKKCLQSLPIGVYDLCAEVASHPECNGFQLQDKVLRVVNTSQAYLHHHAIAECHIEPLSLTQGDTAANLRSFLERPLPSSPPAHRNAAKFWRNGHLDFEATVRDLLVLKTVARSIGLAEEAHAHGSALNRYHRRMGEQVVQLRSALNDSRCMWRLSRSEQRRAHLVSKVHAAEVEVQQTPKYIGRHHFFKLQSELGANSMGMKKGENLKAPTTAYDQLSAERKVALSGMARLEITALAGDRQNKFLELLGDMKSLKKDEVTSSGDAQRFPGPPNTLLSCAFTPQLRRRAAELWFSEEFGSFTSSAPARDETTHVYPPDIDTVDAVHKKVLANKGGRKIALPWWCDIMVQRRDDFERTALGVSEDGDLYPERIFILELACQGPRFCEFREAWFEPCFGVDGNDTSLISRIASEGGFHRYRLSESIYSADMIPISFEDASITLLHQVVYIGGSALANAAVMFDEFLRYLPAKPPREKTVRRSLKQAGGRSMSLMLFEQNIHACGTAI